MVSTHTVVGLSMPNNTGMQLTEFKNLLRKVMNTPGMLEDIATGGIIPTGGIIAWAGTSVPTGWYLCDGTNGTPDLTAKFIYGGAIADVGTTAAAQNTVIANHSALSDHSVTQPAQHASNTTSGNGATTSTPEGGGIPVALNTTNHTHTTPALSHTGTAVDAHSSISAHSVSTQYFPPYYTLAYIQKS